LDPFHVVKLLNKPLIDTIRGTKLTHPGLPTNKQGASDRSIT
jgi:hypothetical protein